MQHSFDPAPWVLDVESHQSADQGICLLEVVALLAGEEMSDHPTCVSAVLAQYGRELNDGLNDVDRQRLVPLAARLVDTADDGLDGWRRAVAADWLGRRAFPRLRQAAGAESDELADSVPGLADELQALARMRLAEAAHALPSPSIQPEAAVSRHIDVVLARAADAVSDHDGAGDVFAPLFAAAVVECRAGLPEADTIDHVGRAITLGDEVGRLLSAVIACRLTNSLAEIVVAGLDAEAPDNPRPIAYGSPAYLAAERSAGAAVTESFADPRSPLHPLPALFRDQGIDLFERMISPVGARQRGAVGHQRKRRDNTAFTPTL
ncbi:MAG: hypothetical protein EPO52_08800 [Herbiconiux sp.]|uniref:hypothetical protein n=1 Tax=Herbiconiux sp. TaxID=1871186 RepID=UPI0012169485|nr:hypothetical protein [Herbiconiux sp.]TAJ48244.1 MAG: hypothetical protein EPO52_08800 [Herbiconiux sp.]